MRTRTMSSFLPSPHQGKRNDYEIRTKWKKFLVRVAPKTFRGVCQINKSFKRTRHLLSVRLTYGGIIKCRERALSGEIDTQNVGPFFFFSLFLKSFSLFYPTLTQKRQDQNQFAIDRINLSPCTWSFCLPKRFVRFVEKFCIGFWPKSKSVEKKKDETRD